MHKWNNLKKKKKKKKGKKSRPETFSTRLQASRDEDKPFNFNSFTSSCLQYQLVYFRFIYWGKRKLCYFHPRPKYHSFHHSVTLLVCLLVHPYNFSFSYLFVNVCLLWSFITHSIIALVKVFFFNPNISFCGEIRKIFTGYPPLSRPMKISILLWPYQANQLI